MGWTKITAQAPLRARAKGAGCAVDGQLRTAVAAGRVSTATPERARERPKGRALAGARIARVSVRLAPLNCAPAGGDASVNTDRFAIFDIRGKINESFDDLRHCLNHKTYTSLSFKISLPFTYTPQFFLIEYILC